MKKNSCRLIVLCAVILNIMLVGYDISFAGTHNVKLEAAHFVANAEMPINDAATLKEHTPLTRESAFEWMFVSAIVLSTLLLIKLALTMSASSRLPVIPQAEAATDKKQAALDNSGDSMKPSRPDSAEDPASTSVFPLRGLTLPPSACKKA